MALLVILNLILLGGMLYKTFGDKLGSGDGLTISLINDFPSPIVDVAFEYPGGKLTLPRIDPSVGISNAVQVPGDFDATLSFKDEAGNTFHESVNIQPIGELTLLLYIQPVLEKMDVTTQDGKAISVLKPSTGRARILPCYKGVNTKLK
jgi:hypothetical protein